MDNSGHDLERTDRILLCLKDSENGTVEIQNTKCVSDAFGHFTDVQVPARIIYLFGGLDKRQRIGG